MCLALLRMASLSSGSPKGSRDCALDHEAWFQNEKDQPEGTPVICIGSALGLLTKRKIGPLAPLFLVKRGIH